VQLYLFLVVFNPILRTKRYARNTTGPIKQQTGKSLGKGKEKMR